MSKEATGSHGQVVGSASYFSQINRSTFWGNADGFDYGRVLRELAGRADSAISSVYDDLQRRKDALLAIPESDRKKLAKQVKALYDVSSMGGGFGSRSSDCISLLESSDGSSFSFFTKNELNKRQKENKKTAGRTPAQKRKHWWSGRPNRELTGRPTETRRNGTFKGDRGRKRAAVFIGSVGGV